MTAFRLLKNGSEAFPAMFAAIDGARSSVAAEMYIVADDRTGGEFRDCLARAAERGVSVKVLIDAVGSWNLADGFWDALRAAGGDVRWFRPIARGMLTFRNHRKLLLIDNRQLFIGGMNITDQYYRGAEGEAPWRDTMLEITGPDAEFIIRSFQRMWLRADRRIRRVFFSVRREGSVAAGGSVNFLESGPEYAQRPVREAYRRILRSARTRIDLAVSYFYPPGRMLRALRRAAGRGVKVRLLFPRKSDVTIARWAAQGLYGRLLRSGIEVWEYLPAMMHAKVLIADDTVIAGSANLDVRSGRINYELVAAVTDQDLATKAGADFEDDLKESVRVDYAEWKQRTLVQRALEWLSYCLIARLDIFFARLEMPKKRDLR